MPQTTTFRQTANLLLLDDSEVAGLAMRGIVGRSRNRCVLATTIEAAWALLRELVVIDLVIVEIKLAQQNGADFISQVRADPVFGGIPIVVYTRVQDHSPAAKLRALGIQNYVIQPYHDEVVHAEIAAALTHPWREKLLEPEAECSRRLGISPRDLARRRTRLLGLIGEDIAALTQGRPPERKEGEEPPPPLLQASQEAGFAALAHYLEEVQQALQAGATGILEKVAPNLEAHARLLRAALNPLDVPAALLATEGETEPAAAKDKALWLESNIDLTGPITDAERVMELVDALPSCPVVDTIAAEFIMAAESKSTDIEYLMDFVSRDPGLSAEVLVAANKLHQGEGASVDHPSVAVGVLGNTALAGVAKAMPLIRERHMDVPPVSWSRFWLFQMGVAAVSLHTARQLELKAIEDYAYTAGLLHDLGKLVLLGIHPYGFQAMARHAHSRSISLHAAEKAYMGCTSREMAVRFCEKHPLPAPYQSVLKWVEAPHQATEHVELVAVVSLARTLCMHHHLGYCGDTPKDLCPPVDETPAWQVLKFRVYPTFNIRRFDHNLQAHCQQLKQELLGKGNTPAASGA
ncbi:MAG TPA: hypothetical protein DCM86_07730 [Verrucomicrobiales bacterium]|nr:hypothetical protein [Verrucomicrobiales bacterium]